eukprot:Skav232879  [mRNA]  locus=scaffold1432:98188:100037:- [translate_table: standard]
MLDFDTLCGRKTPSVAAVINVTGEATFAKFLFGSSDVLIPAPKMLVNFASFRSVFESTMEALKFSEVIKTQAAPDPMGSS